jgi:alkanesulfonate monooxygenase SsuD/methylene tetrahydromethanopterin reductase-like flavin-dependent oxidoreductase (luciferase family)
MLRLAGREGDGAIINWLAADDVTSVAPIVHAAGSEASDREAASAPKEIVARIFVAPTTDHDTVVGIGRRVIASYLNVPVYAAFHEWLGRGEALTPMWDAWKAGDRAAALEAIPDEVVDQLIVHGSPEACREHLERYRANGVDTTAVALMPFPGALSQQEAYRALAPR